VTIALIDEAVASGARVEKACDVVGISTRTLERWRADEECVDRRAGPRHAPAHQLTAAEKAKILEVANSPEFRDKSPKQIIFWLTRASTSRARPRSTACCARPIS
jgi:putative transposase